VLQVASSTGTGFVAVAPESGISLGTFADNCTVTSRNVVLAFDGSARYEQEVKDIEVATYDANTIGILFGSRVDTGTRVYNTWVAGTSEYSYYFAQGGINVDFDKGWRADRAQQGGIYWRIGGGDDLSLLNGTEDNTSTASASGPMIVLDGEASCGLMLLHVENVKMEINTSIQPGEGVVTMYDCPLGANYPQFRISFDEVFLAPSTTSTAGFNFTTLSMIPASGNSLKFTAINTDLQSGTGANTTQPFIGIPELTAHSIAGSHGNTPLLAYGNSNISSGQSVMDAAPNELFGDTNIDQLWQYGINASDFLYTDTAFTALATGTTLYKGQIIAPPTYWDVASPTRYALQVVKATGTTGTPNSGSTTCSAPGSTNVLTCTSATDLTVGQVLSAGTCGSRTINLIDATNPSSVNIYGAGNWNACTGQTLGFLAPTLGPEIQLLTKRSAAPTTGTWVAGDEVQNDGSITNVSTTSGWQCTVSGTPGTWVALGSGGGGGGSGTVNSGTAGQVAYYATTGTAGQVAYYATTGTAGQVAYYATTGTAVSGENTLHLIYDTGGIHDPQVTVEGENTGSGIGVKGDSQSNYGVYGSSISGDGVHGSSSTGVGGSFTSIQDQNLTTAGYVTNDASGNLGTTTITPGVTQVIAGPGVNVSPSGGTGAVTVSASGGSNSPLAGANVVFPNDSLMFDDSANTLGAVITATAASIDSSGLAIITAPNTYVAGQWVNFIDNPFSPSCLSKGPSGLAYYGSGTELHQVLATGLSTSQFEVQTSCPAATGTGGPIEDATYFVSVRTATLPDSVIATEANAWYVRNGVDVANIYSGYTGMVCEDATNFNAMFGDLLPSVTGKPLVFLMSSPGINDLGGVESVDNVKACFQSFWSQAHAAGATIFQNTIPTINAIYGLLVAPITTVNTWLVDQGKNTSNAASGQYWDFAGVNMQVFGEISGNHFTPSTAAQIAQKWNAILADPGSGFTDYNCNSTANCATVVDPVFTHDISVLYKIHIGGSQDAPYGYITGNSGLGGWLWLSTDSAKGNFLLGHDTYKDQISGGCSGYLTGTWYVSNDTPHIYRCDGTTWTEPFNSYSLPIASTSTLGGVKPDGSSCTVNATSGVLTCPGTGGAANYQTVQADGTTLAAQPKLHLISGVNATVSCVNNPSASSTDCTVSSTGGGSGAMVQIAQVVVTSAIPTITFSSIPGTYTNLQLQMSDFTTYGSGQSVDIRFNGDGSTGDYSGKYLCSNGSGTISSNSIVTFAGTSASQATVNINGYSGTVLTKTFSSENQTSSGGDPTCQYGGAWNSTAAITSFTMTPENSANFGVGTVATLYGIQ
jgi:hypothetical protein